jgi:hypothetical protein
MYDIQIDSSTVGENLERIRGQIFRCLPVYEEGGEWRKPLETLIVELLGIHSFFPENKELLSLICKLEGLRVGTEEEIDFMLYRRTIFEACGLINKIKELCE